MTLVVFRPIRNVIGIKYVVFRVLFRGEPYGPVLVVWFSECNGFAVVDILEYVEVTNTKFNLVLCHFITPLDFIVYDKNALVLDIDVLAFVV